MTFAMKLTRFIIYFIVSAIPISLVIDLVIQVLYKTPMTLAEDLSITSIASAQNSSKTGAEHINFNLTQEKLIKELFREDIEVFAKGGKSIFHYNITKVKAETIFNDYDSNEVKGDKLYRGHELIVNGTVGSIDRSIGENYFISFRTNEDFCTVQAHFDKKYIDELASLQKGQKIFIHCIGDGMLMHMPTLKDCQPIEDWIVSKVENEYKNLSEEIRKIFITRKFDDLKHEDQAYIFFGMCILTSPDQLTEKLYDYIIHNNFKLKEEIGKSFKSCGKFMSEEFFTQNLEIQEAKATHDVDRLIKIIKEAREKEYSERTSKKNTKKLRK